MKEEAFINIVLIDDEHYILKGLSELIPWNELGFSICGTFTSAKDALQFIQQHHVDVVMTDILMPNMNGIELTKELSTNYPHIQTLILSSSNEFTHVKEALTSGAKDYMLKPNINLSSMKEFLQRNIPQSIALQTLQKEEFSIEEAGFNAIQQTKFQYLYVYGIYLIDQPAFPIVFFANQIKNTGIENIDTYIFSEQNHHLLLINTATKITLDTFTNNQSYTVLFPCSENVHDMLCAIQILSEIDTPINFYTSSNRIVWDYAWHTYTSASVTETSLKLQQYIQQRNWEEFDTQFRNSFTRDPIFIPKNELISIYLNLALAFLQHDNNRHDQAFTKISLLKSISSKKSLDELNDEILHIAEHFSATPIFDCFKQQILDYIEKNYHRKISLQDVASHFHFNYNYFSNQFNAMVGTSFNEYLNKVRIDKAKELLQSTLALQDVAMQTGFSDIAYFSKVFKKVVGFTPSKYKRMVHQLEQH